MAWFRLDDSWLGHPKHLAAGLHGRALFVAAGTHCAQQLTDGVIEKSSLPLIAVMAGVKPSVARKLVEIGLFEDHDDHFILHDFLEYNRSREQVLAERDRWKRSKKKSRADSNEESTVDTSEESTQASTLSRPVPSPMGTSSSDSTTPATSIDDESITAVIDAMAAAKSKHGGAKGPGWYVSVKADDLAQHGEQIATLLAEFPGAPATTIAARVLGESTPTLANYRRKEPAA